ncbi:MAG: OmpA family protein [Desulfatibacillaceae bacterium]
MRIAGVIAAVCVVLLCVSAQNAFAEAEVYESAFNVTPMAGVHVFEGNQDLEPGITYGLGLGYNFTRNWAGEFSFFEVDSDSELNQREHKARQFKVEGMYNFMPDGPWVPFLAVGMGTLTNDPQIGDTDTDFMLDWGGGLKYFFNHKVALRGDLRHLMAFDETTHNLTATLGFTFQIGGHPPPRPVGDMDGDGIPNDLDKCPNTPAGVEVGPDGCCVDTDRDGVCDYMDKCPNTKPGSIVDAEGCCPDADGDGVCDPDDKCPNTPAGTQVGPDGCCVDSDGDGVCDYADACPGTPAGVAVNEDGCCMDSDMDGVCDYLDACPDTRPGANVDEAGCYLVLKEKVTIELYVQFDFDKAEVKPEFHDDLKEVAEFMKTFPDTRAVLEGHTDSIGNKEYNIALSKRRAQAVRDYLIDNFNISADRFGIIAFGESRPIAPNDTPEGRYKNRRVEAEITATDEAE